MAYFTSEDEKLRENERLYAPVAVTATELRRTIVVGGSVHDATAVVRGLTVRIWWEAEQNLPAGQVRAYGWKWSLNGEGPDVWYPDVDMIFQYLADRWGPIEAEAKGETLQANLDDVVRDRSALLRQVRDLRAELAQARVEVDQVIAQRDALKAKLGWAQDELSKVWSALRGLR